MASHNETGHTGEKLARNYLEEQGYEILEENWVFQKAEIDLVAYKNSTIVFIEVKTRTSVEFGQPEDFVNAIKKKLLKKAAEEYIHLMDFKGEIRFDIISIIFNKHTDNPQLKHIEDAFW